MTSPQTESGDALNELRTRILVIDDDPSIRLSLDCFLQDEGFEVTLSESGNAGIENFIKSPPDMALVDLRLPDMHGLQVIRRLSAAAPHVPLVVVSGTGLLEDAVASLREGAWDYVTKPIMDMMMFRRLLDRMLERAQLLTENDAYRVQLEAMVSSRTAELETALQQLRATLHGAVRSLSQLTSLKDAYTVTHQHRVSKLACAIASEVGFTRAQQEAVQVAATLHDIGKLCIPSEYLIKPSKLDTHEMAFVRLHPEFGYEILRGIPFPSPIAEIVLQHHERLDGSGYPAQLKDSAIMPEARVLAVADVFEAMCAHRPYRPAHSVKTAIHELESQRGRLYCPSAVDACLALAERSDPLFNALFRVEHDNPSTGDIPCL